MFKKKDSSYVAKNSDYFNMFAKDAARLEELRTTGRKQRGEEMENVKQQAVPDGWLRAIDEALVVHHVGIADASDSYEVARDKLNRLLCCAQDIGALHATQPAEQSLGVAQGDPTREHLLDLVKDQAATIVMLQDALEETPPDSPKIVWIDGLGASRNHPRDCRNGIEYLIYNGRTYYPLSDAEQKLLQEACCGRGEFPPKPAQDAPGLDLLIISNADKQINRLGWCDAS